MVEHHLELQEAINMLTVMFEERVTEYIGLKASLPLLGAEVDLQLSKYLSGLENFIQGTVSWNYMSLRKSLDPEDK